MCGASRSCTRSVEEHLRGTYAGLGGKAVIDHIKSIGVTSVELLPIHSFINDDYLLDKHLTNYWGYNIDRLFCPRSPLRRRPRQLPARIQGDGVALP